VRSLSIAELAIPTRRAPATTCGGPHRISRISYRGNRARSQRVTRATVGSLPLSELIFLYTDDDIRVWLLANPGKDPLDLLVLESRQDQGEGRDETPAAASGGHPFCDRKAWDRWGPWDDIGAGDDDDDDDESLNDGSGSQDEDNVDHSHHDEDRVPPGQVHTPDHRGRDIIQGDEVSFLLFSFNILSNHISRTTTGTAVNRSVGTHQGAIILPSEIPQADVPGIHDTGIQTLGHLRRSRLES